MIGISLNGHGSINIGPLPDHERLAFYVVCGGAITAIAYFRNDTEAMEGARMLRILANTPSYMGAPDAETE